MDSGDSLNQRPQTPLERFIPNPKLKFMEQCREVMRFRRLAYRSEQAYLEWIKRFILFQGKRHPKDMGGAGEPLKVFGDGRQTRCFCLVNDVVEALVMRH